MKETTDSVHPEATEQSMKHMAHGYIAWDRELNNKEGRNVNASNNTRDGRESAYNSNVKQSFASLFKDNRAPIEASLLSYIAPTVDEIIIRGDEIDSVEEMFGFCLVGYVFGNRPSPYMILNLVKGWGENVKFAYMDNGWIKFQFFKEEDRDRILNGGSYMILGRRLFLKKMPDCFLFRKEDMEFIPAWIQIFGLPEQCWTSPTLSRIASVIGKPIHSDLLTINKKGNTYARVLVEIDAKKPRIFEYSVKLPTGISTIVRFKYEDGTKYCHNCKSMGHTTEMCGVEGPNNTMNNGNTDNIPGSNGIKNLDEDIQNKIDGIPILLEGEIAEANSSGSKICVETDVGQHTIDLLKVLADKGKGIVEEDNAMEDGGAYGDAKFDEENYFEGNEFSDFQSEGYLLDSDDVDDLHSPEAIQDREEKKTVTKKHKRVKNKTKPKKPVKNKKKTSGMSSKETEYVPADPNTKKPLTGQEQRFSKKNAKEGRPPDACQG